MNILALDPARKCGWARCDQAGRLVSGVTNFDAPTFGNRAHHYRNWLLEKVRSCDIDILAVEQMFTSPTGSNEKTEKWLRAVNIIAHEIAAARNIAIEEAHIGSWRVHFIGMQAAPKKIGEGESKSRRSRIRREWIKNRVMMQCRERGWKPQDDNEADALGILDYVRSKHDRDYAANSTPLFSKGAAA